MSFNFSTFEKTWDDTKEFRYKITIPEKPVVESITLAAAGESAATSGVTTLIMTTALTGASSQVWGLINGLQLVVHLPLVMEAAFPDFA